MLVYGHPEYRERLRTFLAQLEICVTRAQPGDLEQLRELLVQVGQLEQAVEDFESINNSEERTIAAQARELADLAAAAFLRGWWNQSRTGFRPTRKFGAALDVLAHFLSAFRVTSDPLLTFKIPEGFEFYALFPEQYCQAALNWVRDHSRDIEDLSGGLWRKSVFASQADWPAALGKFERMKFRCSTSGGTLILWKFMGLGCRCERRRLSSESAEDAARANRNLVVLPLGGSHGFAAFPWIEGAHLRRCDAADPKLLKQLGQYLLASAGPALSQSESQAGISRLQEMLYCNVGEALGDKAAIRCQNWADSALAVEPTPSYTDGRMAPYEWIRTEAGRLIKTDSSGHEFDHTLVGHQSLLWDVAAAMLEWDLSPASAQPMLKPLREAGIRIEPPALHFYQMAYAAFRMGAISLCAGQSPADPAEQNRLERASADYRRKLEELLKAEPPLAQRRSGWPEAPARPIGSRR